MNRCACSVGALIVGSAWLVTAAANADIAIDDDPLAAPAAFDSTTQQRFDRIVVDLDEAATREREELAGSLFEHHYTDTLLDYERAVCAWEEAYCKRLTGCLEAPKCSYANLYNVAKRFAQVTEEIPYQLIDSQKHSLQENFETLRVIFQRLERSPKTYDIAILELVSTPAGSEVSIDGFPLRVRTKTRIAVQRGRSIRFSAVPSDPAYDNFEQTLDVPQVDAFVEAGGVHTIRVEFKRKLGWVVVEVTPEDAKVEIDGSLVGAESCPETAPTRRRGIFCRRATLGEHSLSVTHSKRAPFNRPVSVGDESHPKRIRVFLAPLPAKITPIGSPENVRVTVDGASTSGLVVPGSRFVEVNAPGFRGGAQEFPFKPDGNYALQYRLPAQWKRTATYAGLVAGAVISAAGFVALQIASDEKHSFRRNPNEAAFRDARMYNDVADGLWLGGGIVLSSTLVWYVLGEGKPSVELVDR